MEKRVLSGDNLEAFKQYLISEERSTATIEKYCRDISAFLEFVDAKEITKEIAIDFKSDLISRGYAVSSINSMLAAINGIFTFMGWYELKLRFLKVQRKIFCPEEKELTREEYERLVRTAEVRQNKRLSLILQAICSTGIRISELQFMTVSAVQRGEVIVSCKNKIRTVFIVRELQRKLLQYCKDQGILSGSVFVTRNGKPVNRTNIWREMKDLYKEAQVDPRKIFPHNLRHLFARMFYRAGRDIAKLADVLGHSSINTTRIYIVETGAQHRRYMENLHLIL